MIPSDDFIIRSVSAQICQAIDFLLNYSNDEKLKPLVDEQIKVIMDSLKK